MARKPSDDIRDAKRELKIKNQQIEALNYNSKGESKGWSTDPTVKKTPDYRSNKDGFRVDWDEKHHIQGLNLYESYTAGMSAGQIKKVDERLAQQGMFKGNVGPNRIDLPRRFHESSKHEGYEGAHQVTKREGIDSRGELGRLQSLTPEQRLNEIDDFAAKQSRHRQVGQQQYMKQFQLEPGNNSKTNSFGGNFSQAILQDRDKGATAKAGTALRKERQVLKAMKIPKGVRKAAQYLLPGASLTIGLGQAGHAASQGDYAGAAAHGVGALVGEVPIVGDVIVDSVAGSGVADGTLDANLNRVPKQGPVNTAAPTGNKKFDNVFQPTYQMLNGITPAPKKPDFKQTAISAFNTP